MTRHRFRAQTFFYCFCALEFMLGVNWFNWEWAKSGGWRRCAGTGRLIWKQTQIQWRFLKGNETTASGGFVAEHLRISEEKWKLRDYHKRRRVLLPFWDRKCDCVRKIEAVDPQFGLRLSVICYGGDGGAHGAEKGRNSLSFFQPSACKHVDVLIAAMSFVS